MYGAMTLCTLAPMMAELSACCPVDLSVVSRHLAILRDAGIVESQRRGKEVRYRVRFDVLSQTFRHIADAIDACCPDLSDGEKAGANDR